MRIAYTPEALNSPSNRLFAWGNTMLALPASVNGRLHSAQVLLLYQHSAASRSHDAASPVAQL